MHSNKKMMNVIEITESGKPDVLKLSQRSIPEPDTNEVLIKVSAAGINRPDLLQRAGAYPAPPGASDLPGLEVSGHIVSSGSTCKFDIGEAVCALTNGGGYAEYCIAPITQTLRIPKGISLREAACIPETFFTVWTNVFERGDLTSGEKILIHGGSSGIGTTAIQLSRHFGARVFTTTGSDEKCVACKKIGAEIAINYNTSNFDEEIMMATNDTGVNVILDMVGGSYVQKNLKILSQEGRLVQIAFQETPKVSINMLPIMLNRLSLTGSTLRPQSLGAKARIAMALEEKVWPLLDNGKISPIIDKEFNIQDAALAHKYMEKNKHIGKIVLVI